MALPASVLSIALTGAVLMTLFPLMPLGEYRVLLFPVGVISVAIAFIVGGVGLPVFVATKVWAGTGPAVASGAGAALVLAGLVWWRGVLWI